MFDNHARFNERTLILPNVDDTMDGYFFCQIETDQATFTSRAVSLINEDEVRIYISTRRATYIVEIFCDSYIYLICFKQKFKWAVSDTGK